MNAEKIKKEHAQNILVFGKEKADDTLAETLAEIVGLGILEKIKKQKDNAKQGDE